MTQSLDVAIVGAGIVGLANACAAAQRGHQVTVFERDDRARGASIRNFGMIWPIGQPAGDLHRLALESREQWLRVAQSADFWVNPCGSIHLAHRTDELAVLEEFFEQSEALGYECSLLSAEEVLERSPAANPKGLLAGLFSPTELCVDPRAAIERLPYWLAEEYGVRFEFGTAIVGVDDKNVRSADGRVWQAGHTIVCSGADFATLFPARLQTSSMKRCKLQMLKTRPQLDGFSIGPHLASGLTLRHYRNFEACTSLAALKERVAQETPDLDQFGIHVMAAQNSSGEVILGDSHEYDAEIDPFRKASIDDLLVRELRKVIRLPDWTITERWSGIYAKHPTSAWFEDQPMPNVQICTGLGGAGMTLSFGLAERFWKQISP